MKTIGFLFIATALLAQDVAKSAAVADSSFRSVMLIDPKARTSDFVQAFDSLRKDRPTQKILVKTMNSELVNVTDIGVSNGGTLLFIKTLSSQGIRTMIVPIEQVTEIAYSP